MKRVLMLLAAATLPGAALADNGRRDAIIAQTAAALASADYSRTHCPALRIDDDLIKENAQEAETTVDALRADESYAEQVTAIQSVEKSNGRAMVCMVLPSAHGGLARGIITVRSRQAGVAPTMSYMLDVVTSAGGAAADRIPVRRTTAS